MEEDEEGKVANTMSLEPKPRRKRRGSEVRADHFVVPGRGLASPRVGLTPPFGKTCGYQRVVINDTVSDKGTSHTVAHSSTAAQ